MKSCCFSYQIDLKQDREINKERKITDKLRLRIYTNKKGKITYN